MGSIKEEPSFINGEKNPIFGSVFQIKESEMKVENDFNHEHYWKVVDTFENGTRDILCECGKGMTIGKNVNVKKGKLIY